MAKDERAQWFKMFLHQKALIDSVPDETAGKALKAAFRYFDTREMENLDPLAFAVFSVIKPYIDESFGDYKKAVEAGRSGANKRWSKKKTDGNSPPIAPLRPPVGVPTEAEAEADALINKHYTEARESIVADKPPTRPRFSPPSVEDVRTYCMEQGYTAVDPQRFVDYYASNGWMVGKNRMKDWKAAVRGWNSREAEKQTPAPRKKLAPIPGVPTL